MDFTTASLIAIIALIILVGLILIFNRGKAKIKLSNSLGKFEATNELNSKEPAIKIENTVSNKGGVTAEDNTGQGAYIKDVIVEKDIQISISSNSKKKS